MPKRKVDLDQYYTSHEVAGECIDLFTSHSCFEEFDVIIEPSAGSGRFLDFLPSPKTLGLDIRPGDPRVHKQNFLTWTPQDSTKKILVIGNPPFGQRASLATKFLSHSSMFADTIAFVLPRCFNKYTFQNRINRSFHLKFFKNISGSFDYEGDKKEVSVVFQIWEKSDKIRALVKPQSTHRHFLMRHAHMSRTSSFERKLLIDFADIAIPQVGARFKPANPSSINKGSYWFIKFLDGADKSAFNRLDFDFLDGQNTAHKSLSKSDIVRAYQVAIGDSVAEECPSLSLKNEPVKPTASEQLDLILKCDYDSIKRIKEEVA